MIAIVPAAGLGKRMLSVTGGAPKELLQVDGRTLLDWNLDEARSAETSEIVVVSSSSKPELTAACAGVRVVMQERAEGLAFALGLAGSSDSALVLLPDTIFSPQSPVRRMASALEAGADIVLPLEAVPIEEVSSYGIVELEPGGRISRIVEKPSAEEAPSRWAIAGRFALSAQALARVAELASSHLFPGEEVHLPPLLDQLIQEGFAAVGLPLRPNERRFDCGSPEGYAEALRILGQ